MYCIDPQALGAISEKMWNSSFFGDRMEKKHFIFIIGALKYWSSHSSKMLQKSKR